jgi:hypothetical protein
VTIERLQDMAAPEELRRRFPRLEGARFEQRRATTLVAGRAALRHGGAGLVVQYFPGIDYLPGSSTG